MGFLQSPVIIDARDPGEVAWPLVSNLRGLRGLLGFFRALQGINVGFSAGRAVRTEKPDATG